VAGSRSGWLAVLEQLFAADNGYLGMRCPDAKGRKGNWLKVYGSDPGAYKDYYGRNGSYRIIHHL